MRERKDPIPSIAQMECLRRMAANGFVLNKVNKQTREILLTNGWAIRRWPAGLRITTRGRAVIRQNENRTYKADHHGKDTAVSTETDPPVTT